MGNTINTTPVTLTGEEYRQMEEDIEIEQYSGMFNTSEVTNLNLQTNMSEYTIAGSARIINRPYRHPYRQSRTRHCSICGSISHDRRTCQVRIREEEQQGDEGIQIERQNTIDTEQVRREFQQVQRENRERVQRENRERVQRQNRERVQRQYREFIERAQRENRERNELAAALRNGDHGRHLQLLIGTERYNQYIQERRLLTPDTLTRPVTVKKRIELVENFEKDTYLEKNENGDTNCNICLEDININSALVFQCGHGCCNKCAKRILRGNGKCHQCREPIRKIRICRLIPLDIFNSLNNYMKI